MSQIFNTTINRIVDVPDESVGAYLAQSAYRKVKPSDRTVAGDTDTITVSRTEYEARVQQGVAAELAKAAADTQTTPPEQPAS